MCIRICFKRRGVFPQSTPTHKLPKSGAQPTTPPHSKLLPCQGEVAALAQTEGSFYRQITSRTIRPEKSPRPSGTPPSKRRGVFPQSSPTNCLPENTPQPTTNNQQHRSRNAALAKKNRISMDQFGPLSPFNHDRNAQIGVPTKFRIHKINTMNEFDSSTFQQMTTNHIINEFIYD